eukprot:Amastigsp_a686655_3.p4 type:complete len:103 gc:universal Amastigsp_a686655_3:621-313(-)
MPPWKAPAGKRNIGFGSCDRGHLAHFLLRMSWMSRAPMTAFEVCWYITSRAWKCLKPPYAAANDAFETTEVVAVDGAMLVETMEPSARATIERQCWIRFASA